ncbi:MAG: internalin, partial [Solobacterium sp.]|nr:internalin [Solobacterium sp.]
TYSVTYKVTDNDGLSATQVATVTVIAKASVKTADTTSIPMYVTLFGFSTVMAMILWIFKKQKLSSLQ